MHTPPIISSRRPWLALLLFGSLLVTGCKKYEDGPRFSLRSRSGRLSNDWTIDSYVQHFDDGRTVDMTADIANSRFDIDKSGDYEFFIVWKVPIKFGIPTRGEGEWKFSDDQESMTVFLENWPEPIDYKILRLKKDDVWLELQQSDRRTEIHLDPA